MRLFVWSHYPLIGIRNGDDSNLGRYGASSGNLRVMRLRPFPEPARGTTMEIPMTGILSELLKTRYGDDFKSY